MLFSRNGAKCFKYLHDPPDETSSSEKLTEWPKIFDDPLPSNEDDILRLIL